MKKVIFLGVMLALVCGSIQANSCGFTDGQPPGKTQIFSTAGELHTLKNEFKETSLTLPVDLVIQTAVTAPEKATVACNMCIMDVNTAVAMTKEKIPSGAYLKRPAWCNSNSHNYNSANKISSINPTSYAAPAKYQTKFLIKDSKRLMC